MLTFNYHTLAHCFTYLELCYTNSTSSIDFFVLMTEAELRSCKYFDGYISRFIYKRCILYDVLLQPHMIKYMVLFYVH